MFSFHFCFALTEAACGFLFWLLMLMLGVQSLELPREGRKREEKGGKNRTMAMEWERLFIFMLWVYHVYVGSGSWEIGFFWKKKVGLGSNLGV